VGTDYCLLLLSAKYNIDLPYLQAKDTCHTLLYGGNEEVISILETGRVT
jgi:hypothetical protein